MWIGYLFAVVFFVWGGSNLVRALRSGLQPTARRERLSSGIAGTAFAAALLCRRMQATSMMWLDILLGTTCAFFWLRSLYKQSLHNTTM